MRAIVFHEFGPPNVLRLEDVPTPEPGPGEVLLKVHGVSVNRTLDLVVRSGLYARRPPLPHVLGVDPCGVVTSVGQDVTDRKVGDRVVCGPVIGVDPNGAPRLLGVNAWGGYAEYVKVPASITHLIPDRLDFQTATVVARHGPLAFTQLRDRAQVQRGEWVLVMGAAGGLGSAAVQAAKYLGARVIAAAGSDARVEAAVALGADTGVNYRKQDLTAEVRRITAGAGANVVLFTTGLGTPTGNPIAPVIKLSTNSDLARRMPDIIDIDTGSIISGESTIEQMGERILEKVIQVASGEIRTKAEQLAQDDFIPWKRGVSL